MAETTVVACPTCGKKFRVGIEKLGKTFKCTGCQNRFVASDQEPEVEPEPMEAPVAPPPVPQMPPVVPFNPAYTGGPPKTSGMAIASLICGILFCIPLASLLALIFGIIGINQTKPGQARGRGLAITGTVLGGLGLLLIPLSIAIMLPALNRAREVANRARCAFNMKQIAMSLIQYQNDYAGANPPDLATLWKTEKNLTGSMFVCPSSSDTPAADFTQLDAGGHCSYVYVGANAKQADDTAVILYEKNTDHAGDGTNILFGNGSVSWHSAADAQRIISSPAGAVSP